jgi:16S rRNA processing protein RimM
MTVMVGKILSTHGLNGDVKLMSFCENPEDIFNYTLLDKNNNIMRCKRVGSTSKPNVFLAKFENLNSIDEANRYRNYELFIKKEDLAEIDDDNSVYVDDLINMKADSGEKKGIIRDVYNYGAGDVVEIEWSDGKIESIPFTETFIREIDKKNSIVYINLPSYI